MKPDLNFVKEFSSVSKIKAACKKSAVPEMDIIPKTVRHQRLTPVAAETKQLITAAQNGDKTALEKLCLAFEPLFYSEMRREMFYNALGFEEGLSLARLKFIELVLTYNGADYEHFAGYVRCRIHYALYDEVKKIWTDENKKAPLPTNDEQDSALTDNTIEREELSLLLNQALAKLTDKQRAAIILIYLNGHSNKETARLLNCSPAMVTKHHKLALKNLKAKIA